MYLEKSKQQVIWEDRGSNWQHDYVYSLFYLLLRKNKLKCLPSTQIIYLGGNIRNDLVTKGIMLLQCCRYF
jgi:hypothetical protein